jgi:hypothetical protein
MKFPNIITGLAAAMRLLWWRIRGYRILATQDEKNWRDWDCIGCRFNVDDQCQKCTCYIPAKIALTTEQCPIGKWDRIKALRKKH